VKRFTAFLLLAVMLTLCLPFSCASAREILYRGEITRRYKGSFTKVYAKMDKNSKSIQHLDPGNKINITAIYPEWVEVELKNGKIGYIIRQRIDVLEAVDPVKTPPYPVCEQPYYVTIDRTVDVKAEKNPASETLSTLTDGARVAVMGCEVNGPGEASEADLGVAGGNGKGLLFRKGEKLKVVDESEITAALVELVKHYEDI
jgi:hypothetical protein